MNMTKSLWKIVAALVFASCPLAALAVSWDGVPASEVGLFYPGQAAWEWVLTPSSHGGAKKFREGKNCRGCHDGEEKDIGDLIVSGEKLEPDPIAGKPGFVNASISATRDDDTLYVKIEWADPGPEGKGEAKSNSKVTMMIGSDAVKEAVRAGCWGACHTDVEHMPDDAGLSKYLAASRTKLTRHGGGENYKSASELADLLGNDMFLEVWQAKLNPGKPAVPVDGYILDKFHYNDSPTVAAEANFAAGKWTVILQRKLADTGAGKRTLESGKTYPVGFAIHSNYADGRHHYVSFEHTLAIDTGEADFVATKR